MAKKSQRRPLRYEKNKSGCMWGFISMFDFRHGHSTRKLIADKRRSSKHAADVVHSKNKFEMLNNLDEDGQGNFDSGESKRLTAKTDANKPSVKNLIEEEMIIDQNATNDVENAIIESKESKLRHEPTLKVDSKRKKRSSRKSRDMDTDDSNLDATLKSDFSHNHHSRQQSKDNLDLDNIIEEFCHPKDGKDGEVHAQSNQKHAISENIARDMISEFVNQMILNGKDLAEARKFLFSQELMEALQLTSSDKELFLTLLQNPNSLLLKCVQECGNSQRTDDKEYSSAPPATGSNFSEQDAADLEPPREIANHKKRNFFRRKVKPQSKGPTNEKANTETANRIVILKPATTGLRKSETGNNLVSSLDSRDTVHYDGPSVRGSSHFSLTEIKKKLKHAMGRERHGNHEGISKKHPVESQNKVPSSKANGKDSVGMRSPNKDHFFIEKIARPSNVMKGDKSGTLKDLELTVGHESSSYPKPRVSNLYIEAKKHLCEMVSNGDENMDLSSRQIPRTLGRILSLPECNFSPLASPVRDWEDHFLTAQTRFSAPNKGWEANDDKLSLKQATGAEHLDQETDKPEKQSIICDESSNNEVQVIKSDSDLSDGLSHVEKEENCCPVRDEIFTQGDVESAREINVSESSSEPGDLRAGKEDQNSDVSKIPESASCPQCLKQDVPEENQPLSPLSSASQSTVRKKNEELECGTDVSGRPSPVSVLDTPFLDDDVPVQVPVRSLQIQFEEQDSSPLNQTSTGKFCLEETELIYDYIKVLMQASGLTRDQLWMKCLSSGKILDPSLIDQVEFLPNQLCHDRQLLYDCINEVLKEISWHYFGVSPWLCLVNPSIRPTPTMQKLVLKVWEGVCWNFLPLPPPRTLDKIVRKDMEKSGAWMNLKFEAETIGFEMGEAILAELMEDTILSCASGSPESKCSQLQLESNDNKSSANV